MSYSVRKKLFQLIPKIAFVFEPLAPRAISYFLSRKVTKLKKSGLVYAFQIKTKRLGKFHYFIEIDLDLTSSQIRYFMKKIFPYKISDFITGFQSLKSTLRTFNISWQ